MSHQVSSTGIASQLRQPGSQPLARAHHAHFEGIRGDSHRAGERLPRNPLGPRNQDSNDLVILLDQRGELGHAGLGPVGEHLLHVGATDDIEEALAGTLRQVLDLADRALAFLGVGEEAVDPGESAQDGEAPDEATRVKAHIVGVGVIQPGWKEAVDGVWKHFLVDRYQPYVEGLAAELRACLEQV